MGDLGLDLAVDIWTQTWRTLTSVSKKFTFLDIDAPDTGQGAVGVTQGQEYVREGQGPEAHQTEEPPGERPEARGHRAQAVHVPGQVPGLHRLTNVYCPEPELSQTYHTY